MNKGVITNYGEGGWGATKQEGEGGASEVSPLREKKRGGGRRSTPLG